jgi:DNA-binding NarL/FixJ family response regulator
MKVLYVTSAAPDASPAALERILAAASSLEAHLFAGTSAALAELRTNGGYDAVLVDPGVPHNEQLALIATIRRDRLPVAVVNVITPAERSFFGPAMTAGADDVLLVTAEGIPDIEATLERIRLNRHVDRREAEWRLGVIYVGQDDLAWDLIADMPFVAATRAISAADGSCPLAVAGESGAMRPADAIVVDEHPGESHPLEVIKWIRTQSPGVRIVMLTSATAADAGGAALDLGASDVVSKSGTYRRRLTSALHQAFREGRRASPALVPPPPPAPTPAPTAPAGPGPDEAAAAVDAARAQARAEHAREIDALRTALETAETRIRQLTQRAHAVAVDLERQQQRFDELKEAQAFERAMRERDRDELSRIRQALTDERERRIVLEETLRHTEDRAAADVRDLEARHAEARRQLADDIADAADRLHAVATETQTLQTRLQQELNARTAERERLIQSELFGYGVVRADGRLIRCNTMLATVLGFDSADDALAADGMVVRARLADHDHVAAQLAAGTPVSAVESVLTRANGRPFRVLTAAFSLETGDDAGAIERVVIDLDDRTRLEEQLRLARRLETAGRLGAEMADEIDRALARLNDPAAPAADRATASSLIEQLVAFCRRQARPAGLLSPAEAIRRIEPHLRQIAGDAVRFELDVHDVPAIAAGEDDMEQLVSSLVHAAVGSLPYGGRVTLRAASERDGFALRTELSVHAAGYGTQPLSISTYLARLVTRCGGTVRVADDSGRSTHLIVRLPC